MCTPKHTLSLNFYRIIYSCIGWAGTADLSLNCSNTTCSMSANSFPLIPFSVSRELFVHRMLRGLVVKDLRLACCHIWYSTRQSGVRIPVGAPNSQPCPGPNWAICYGQPDWDVNEIVNSGLFVRLWCCRTIKDTSAPLHNANISFAVLYGHWTSLSLAIICCKFNIGMQALLIEHQLGIFSI